MPRYLKKRNLSTAFHAGRLALPLVAGAYGAIRNYVNRGQFSSSAHPYRRPSGPGGSPVGGGPSRATRGRFARARSLTKTRTKKRRRRGAYGGTADMSKERFKLVLSKRPVSKRSKQKLKYEEIWQGVASGNEGSQLVTEARYHQHINAFCTTSTVRNNLTTQGFSLGDLLPNQKITGNNAASIAGYAAGQASTMPSYNLESAKCTMEIANLENASCTVWVYFMLAKRNSTDSPSVLWDAQLNTEAVGTSVDVPTVTTDNTWAVGQVTKTFLNQSPLANSQVRKFFKCMKVCKFELDGGQTHVLNYDLIINKIIDMYYMNNLYTSLIKFVGGLSIVPLVVARGSLVGISDTPASTTASEVTTAPTKLGIICTRRYVLSERTEPPAKPATLASYGVVSSAGSHVFGPSLIDDEDKLAGIIKV